MFSPVFFFYVDDSFKQMYGTHVNAFLGLVTYYSKFVNLPTIRYPLNESLKKNGNFNSLLQLSSHLIQLKVKLYLIDVLRISFLSYL